MELVICIIVGIVIGIVRTTGIPKGCRWFAAG